MYNVITYFISDSDYIKIGKTKFDLLDKRLAQLQTGNPKRLRYELIIFDDMEVILHKALIKHRVRNEWYELSINNLKEIVEVLEKLKISYFILYNIKRKEYENAQNI